MTLATRLPWQHPFSGGYPRLGGQALPTDPDAIDYLQRQAAVDGPVEVGVAMAVDQFVKGCKADSAGYAGDPTRTVWDALQACCIMAGARTISGALVPLRRGSELWAWQNVSSIFQAGGSCGTYDQSTRTLSNPCVGISTVSPRFYFDIGATVGRKYVVTGRLSGDTGDVGSVRLGSTSSVPYNGSTGVFSGTVTAAESQLIVYIDGTKAPSTVVIEEVSVREDFTPTPYNFTASDYNRTTGIKGDGSTTYLDTNRAGNADGQNDHHLAVYKSSTGDTLTKWYAGTSDSSVPSFSLIGEDGAYSRTTARLGTFSNSASTGLFGISRQSSSSASYIRLGAVTSVAAASYAVTDTRNSLVFGRNDSVGLVGASNARLAFYSIGSSLDLAALDNRVSTLIAAIAAALS